MEEGTGRGAKSRGDGRRNILPNAEGPRHTENLLRISVLSLEEMRASLLQKRLHDINLDLLHVLVSTESAVQEASGMAPALGSPLQFNSQHYPEFPPGVEMHVVGRCRSMSTKAAYTLLEADVADC